MTATDDQVPALRARIDDLEQALIALRDGAVDALVGPRPGEATLYSLASADRPYRVIVERMGQGAATATPAGVMLFANARLAELLGIDRDALIGADLASYVGEAGRPELARLLAVGEGGTRRGELVLRGASAVVPVLAAVTSLDLEGDPLRCLIVTDLTVQKQVERRQAEEAALAKQRDERARVAREVNDTIVQGLVAAEMALDLGQVEAARDALARTSARARGWIGELVEGGQLEAGMAVRSTPGHPGPVA